MTIEELVLKVNNSQKSKIVKDKRLNVSLTERRLRDYISKGLVKNGVKKGKRVYYSDDHVKQIINIRNLQSSGYTDKLMFSSISGNNNDLKSEDLLKSLKEKNIKKTNIKKTKVLKLNEFVTISYPESYDFKSNIENIKEELNKLRNLT